MKQFSLKYKLVVVTVIALLVWAVAADLPFTFKAGDVISAQQMNQDLAALNNAKQERVAGTCAAGSSIRTINKDGTVVCETDAIGSGSGGAGVSALNGMTGAVTLQAGSNIAIDDSVAGQIKISATGGGSSGGSYSADGTSLTLNGTTFSIKDGGVSTGKLADSAVTGAKVGVPLSLSGSSSDPVFAATNSGSGYGVVGSSSNAYTAGVLGQSTRTSVGGHGVGVRGLVGSATGVAPGYGAAVWGESSADSYGVFAYSAKNISLYAQNSQNIAIKGQSTSGYGVVGSSSSTVGVYGVSGSASGLSVGLGGVWGDSENYPGVAGTSKNLYGVFGDSSTGTGVYGTSDTGNSAYFYGGSAGSGHCSYAGGAGWNCTSDKNAKENFQPVNSAQVLEALVKMPISTWNMKGDLKKTPHMGPVAQDFKVAFGLGDNDITINTADAQGVALAAIQGLNQKLEQENQALKAQMVSLEARLGVLEKQSGTR